MRGFEIFFINFFFLCLALTLYLILGRLRVGPSLADRVVAIDLFATVLLSAVAVAAVYMGEAYYFDIALIIALFSFLGSTIFAWHIQKQERRP